VEIYLATTQRSQWKETYHVGRLLDYALQNGSNEKLNGVMTHAVQLFRSNRLSKIDMGCQASTMLATAHFGFRKWAQILLSLAWRDVLEGVDMPKGVAYAFVIARSRWRSMALESGNFADDCDRPLLLRLQRDCERPTITGRVDVAHIEAIDRYFVKPDTVGAVRQAVQLLGTRSPGHNNGGDR
jgi:hypothetical protein